LTKTTILGLDEHNDLIIDLNSETCQVLGNGEINSVEVMELLKLRRQACINRIGGNQTSCDSGWDGWSWLLLMVKSSKKRPATGAPG